MKKKYYVAAIAIFYLMFHLFITPDYWDDATFMKELERFRHRPRCWEVQIH